MKSQNAKIEFEVRCSQRDSRLVKEEHSQSVLVYLLGLVGKRIVQKLYISVVIVVVERLKI